MRRGVLVLAGVAAALSYGPTAAQEAGPIGPVDYPAISKFLREPLPEPVQAVRFEELWREPSRWSGRAVRVSGVSRRVFRQPAVGEFPALVELWITDAAGNPIGLLFPDRAGWDGIGRQVAFQGRVHRMVDFPDGTGVRRAPLIVGPEPPNMAVDRPIAPAGGERGETEWALGGLLLLFVVVVLGVQHARRPKRRGGPRGPRPSFEPPIENEPGATDG